jgi:amino acid transporter
VERAPRQGIVILTAISAGLALASSCFPLLAQTVRDLGAWALGAVAITGALAWLVSRAYAELASMFPTAAGVRTYTGQAFGGTAGLAVALLYLLLIVALGASETFVLTRVLDVAVPGLPATPVVLGFIGACAALNVVGVEPSGRFQAVTTFGMLGLAGALGLLFAWRAPLAPELRTSLAPMGTALPALAGSVFLFVGFEWVVSAVEEVDPTGCALPRAMSFSIGVLAATYAVLVLAFWLGLGHAELGAGVVPHLALGRAGGGALGLALMAAVSIAATVTSFNGGILGASRLVYALAREGALPRGLARLHPRFLTPWAATLVVAALALGGAALVVRTGAYEVPLLAASAIECLVFAVVLLALVRLRATRPDRPRPARAPFGAAVAIPLAVVFVALAAGCVIASGERALVTAALLGTAIPAAGTYAWIATRRAERARSKPRVLVGGAHG